MTLETVNLNLNKKLLQLEHEMNMLREKNILLETENSQLIDRVQELENELGRIRLNKMKNKGVVVEDLDSEIGESLLKENKEETVC